MMNPRSLIEDDRLWTIMRIIIGIVITAFGGLIAFLATDVIGVMNERDAKVEQKIDVHTSQLGEIKTTLGEIKTFLKTVTKQRDTQIDGIRSEQNDHENRIRVIEHAGGGPHP